MTAGALSTWRGKGSLAGLGEQTGLLPFCWSRRWVPCIIFSGGHEQQARTRWWEPRRAEDTPTAPLGFVRRGPEGPCLLQGDSWASQLPPFSTRGCDPPRAGRVSPPSPAFPWTGLPSSQEQQQKKKINKSKLLLCNTPLKNREATINKSLFYPLSSPAFQNPAARNLFIS